MISSATAIYLPQANIELKPFDFEGIRLLFDLEHGVSPGLSAFNAPRIWRQATPGPLPCTSSGKAGPHTCPIQQTFLSGIKNYTEADFQELRDYQVWCNIFGNVSPTSDYNIFLVDRLKQKDMRFFVRAFNRYPVRFLSLI
jgi:hypothetical protein